MKRLFYLFLSSVVLTVFLGCGTHDKPPMLSTPVPPPHNGVFVNGKDTLWMNGDGKTIRWHFENALPAIGQSGKGEYVFLFSHVLPMAMPIANSTSFLENLRPKGSPSSATIRVTKHSISRR